MPTVETVFGFLRKAQSVEEKAASIYQAAAKRFAADAHWSRLFGRLADEEKQHAMRIKMLVSRLSRDRGFLQSARLQDVDLDDMIAAGEALAKRISAPEELSLSEALPLLRDLEERFNSVHAHVILVSNDPEFNAFFAQLAAQDRAHAEMLGGAPAREPAAPGDQS